MIGYTKHSSSEIRQKAVENLLSMVRLRHGASLNDARQFLLLRFGYSFSRTSKLIRELLDGQMLEGNAKRYRIPGQGGARIV